MIPTPATINVPLRTDADGVIRIGNTRVTLITIIGRHHAGETPEEIHDGFPTVPLTDVYAVLAYYVANRDAVDDYIRRVDEEADRRRLEYEANDPKAAALNAKMRALLKKNKQANSNDD